MLRLAGAAIVIFLLPPSSSFSFLPSLLPLPLSLLLFSHQHRRMETIVSKAYWQILEGPGGDRMDGGAGLGLGHLEDQGGGI